jgi:alkylation response protein AidB-like acyl-CoA dehydrogenase
MSFIHDEQFGEIVDFDALRPVLRRIYDAITPEFNLLETMRIMSEAVNDSPSHMIAAGASMLAYQMIPAAGEMELAEEVKGDGNIFSIGWTEEHCGTDLLSMRTAATPLSDDPDSREYHIKGGKWMINNSYHADYHLVLAKLDPDQSGPRSLSLFLVPRSSCSNWNRLSTHVLRNMVLTEYDIDGPGRLVGKIGYGLQYVQAFASAARYQCTYVGMRMVREAVPESINWLSTKNIFGDNPVNFSNVFRQLYNLALESALQQFIFYRAYATNAGSFLGFNGTMLKSFLLLRINETLSQNLLVAGSKGFVQDNLIGRNVIDSFVLPVFDGHYTLNTFMSAKHMDRYMDADRTLNPIERLNDLRERLFQRETKNELHANLREQRRPDFFDYTSYFKELKLPVDIPVDAMMERVRQMLDEVNSFTSTSSDPEYKYKVGDLLHWMESVLAAAELWALTKNDHYANAVVQQWNKFTTVFNNVVSEGALDVDFLQPLHQLPLPEEVDDPQSFLLDLVDVEAQVKQFAPQGAPGAD